MMNATYFMRREFACKCGCGFAAVDVELLELLTFVRIHFNRPVTITSACRCESHNESEGGAKDSMHIKGMAADIVVKDIHPNDVYAFIDQAYPTEYGLGAYDSFTHVDVRPEKARW